MLLAAPTTALAQSVDYQKLSEMFGEPVTTSVTGKPQRASEAPAALVIITQEDIRRSPARDIVGLIGAYAGIDLARWTEGQSDVAIRGGVQPFNPRLLVLVNGQQVYLDNYGMTNWASIGVQLSEIQQIEIVRGPNSALFGVNAVSGVVNIITINPLQAQRTTLVAEGGTQGYGALSASTAVALGENAGLRLSGGYGHTDERDGLRHSPIALSPTAEEHRPEHVEAAAELYGKLGSGTEAVLSVSHSASRQNQFINQLEGARINNEFTSLGGRVSHDTGWGMLSARLYANRANVHAPREALPRLNFYNEVVVASANALIMAGDANTIRVGVESRSSAFKGVPGYPGNTRYDLYSANAMWEHVVGETVTVTVAGRLDQIHLEQRGAIDQPTIFTKADYDRTINEVSLNSAMLVRLDETRTLRLAVARGVQAPSLSNLGVRIVVAVPGAPIPFVFAGNPRLAPSPILSGELGFAQTLRTGARLEMTGFYHRTKDIVSMPLGADAPRAAPPAFPFVFVTTDNAGTFEAYGVETSVASAQGKAMTWSVNYTWNLAKQNLRGSSGDVFAWRLALDRATPEHKVKAQLSYVEGPWLGAAAVRYTSATQQLVSAGERARLVDIHASIAIDAKIAFKVNPAVTLELAGENLADADGADLSPVASQRLLRAGVRASF